MHEQRVKVLLVALGFYGKTYLEEVTTNELGIELIGVCDIATNLEERFPIIKERSIPVYSSLEAFYEAGMEADLVVLSTPIHVHFAQTKLCLEHGSNVLCEKPICTELKQARELMELERQTNRFVAVGYQLNFSRDVLRLKQDIMEGRFGKPICLKAMHAIRRGASYYARNNWAGKITVQGYEVNDSPFNNACAHQFQMMTFLLGKEIDEAIDVSLCEAELYRANEAVENYDTAALRFQTVEQTPIYYYTTHDLKETRLGPYCEYHFEKATVYFGKNFGNGQVMEYVAVCKDGTTINYGEIAKGKRLQKLYDCIDACQSGMPVACTIRSAMPHLHAVLQLVEVPIRSIAKEKLVRLETEEDTFVTIRELSESVTKCFEQEKLPGEIGITW